MPRPSRTVLGPWQRQLARILISGSVMLTATGLFLFFSDGDGSASSLSLILHIAGGAALFLVLLAFAIPHAVAQRRRRPSIRVTGFVLLGASLLLMGTGVWPLLEEVAARRTWARTLHVAAGAAALLLYFVHRRRGVNPLSRQRYAMALLTALGIGAAFFAYDRINPESELRELFAERIGTDFTLTQTPGNKYVAVDEVDDSKGCIDCHERIVQDWRRSAHRHASMTNPFYKATVQEMRRVVGPDGLGKTKFCAGCHDPALLFTGEMDKVSLDFEGRAAQVGLSCVACHTIDPRPTTRGNGDYTFQPRRIYAWERSEDPKLREAHAVLIRLKPEAHKQSLHPHNLGTSEYCSTCHKAEIAPELNGWHWFRAQDEYDAWHGSGVSMNNALSFYHPAEAKRCQDCHMPLVSDPNDPTADAQGRVRSHLFAAANTALPALRGDQEMIDRITAFLQTACRIDITSVDVTPQDGDAGGAQTSLPAPLVRPGVLAGDTVEAHVVVRTMGVGHMFPGGTIDSNEVWIEFEAAVGDEAPFYRSGGLDAETGIVDQGAEFYRAWVAGENGERVVSRLGTAVRTRVYVKTIPPGAADVTRYRFRVPTDVRPGELRLRARLRYRKFMREYLDFVFPTSKVHSFRHVDGRVTEFDTRALPIVDMSTTRLSLPIETARRTPFAPTWELDTYERVNDLGIAYLRQGDYERAETCFHQVTLQQPDYADGWVNLARTHFQRRRYDQVIEATQKALELRPGFPKALYFQGEVQRARLAFDRAERSYRAVLETFPEDRQVLLRLGLVLWEQDRPAEALEVLLRLRDIDEANPLMWAQIVNCYKQLGDVERLKDAEAKFRYYRDDDDEHTRRGQLWLTDSNLERLARPIHIHEQAGPK